jgi:predicted CopG family antitoxin
VVFVTQAKTVKMSKEVYARLCEVAGELQMKLKRPVSLDEAMEYLLRERKLRVGDFAGAWSMSDEEEAEILKSLRKAWSRWKFQKG